MKEMRSWCLNEDSTTYKEIMNKFECSVAIAIQRGNAIAVRNKYHRVQLY